MRKRSGARAHQSPLGWLVRDSLPWDEIPLRQADPCSRTNSLSEGLYPVETCGGLPHPCVGLNRGREAGMILEQILKEKGGQVYSVAESATLKEAADLLHARRVGAMVILNEAGGVIGVISERDIVRNIARIGAAALKCMVGEVMTRNVVTARAHQTLEAAMDQMTDRRIRHLPVVEGGRLLGVISIGDLVKWRIAEASAEVEAVRSYIQP
ncbi:MAG: CBS domain-containing protein [Hyphomonadaceae bacterium]